MRRTRSLTALSALIVVGVWLSGTTASATTDPSPTPTPTPTETIVPSPSPTATTAAPAPAPAPAPVRRTTRNGQRLLNGLGCDAGRVTGRLNEHTATAVIRFQAANGLAQTGGLNRATWDRLSAAHKVACNRRPVPGASGEGRRIVVSRTQNWVWLVNGDGSTRWQGGMIDNPRVWASGSYYSGSVCGRPSHSGAGLDYSRRLRLDNFTRVVTRLCGVGFHRIPVYRSSGNQIHADWLLGTNKRESHGCMRVSAATARAITDFTQVRTPVIVKS